jgi:hypothetical protein
MVELRRGLTVYGRVLDPRWIVGGQRGLIVYAQGRSGTTLLGDLLDCHPEIVYEDEILHDPVRFPRAYVMAQRAQHPRSWYGFHVKPYQLSDDQHVADQGRWLRSMVRLGWRIVYLRRTNLVHQVLSNARALTAGAYEARQLGERLGPIEVDPQVILEHAHARERMWPIEERALAGLKHVALTYEEDLLVEEAWQRALDRVFDHLGLSRVPVSTNLRRLGADRLEDLVSNAGELRAALADTPYAHMVADR